MKNIHVLPTDKSSKLYFNHNKGFEKYQFSKDPFINGLTNTTNQNIYITSDEEIEDGDWIITKGTLVQANLLSYDVVKGSKVILTTDQDLIKDGVQEITDEFLEWFVKNPSCEEVEVVYGLFNPMGRQVDPNDLGQNHSKCIWKYKIIIPKEENKQETLNEVALEFAKDHHEMYETSNFGSMHLGFCWGAKWQQEKMYSEEEVKHLMTLAFEQGFKKADVVEAGLEAKETDTEVNWIFLKHKK